MIRRLLEAVRVELRLRRQIRRDEQYRREIEQRIRNARIRADVVAEYEAERRRQP